MPKKKTTRKKTTCKHCGYSTIDTMHVCTNCGYEPTKLVVCPICFEVYDQNSVCPNCTVPIVTEDYDQLDVRPSNILFWHGEEEKIVCKSDYMCCRCGGECSSSLIDSQNLCANCRIAEVKTKSLVNHHNNVYLPPQIQHNETSKNVYECVLCGKKCSGPFIDSRNICVECSTMDMSYLQKQRESIILEEKISKLESKSITKNEVESIPSTIIHTYYNQKYKTTQITETNKWKVGQIKCPKCFTPVKDGTCPQCNWKQIIKPVNLNPTKITPITNISHKIKKFQYTTLITKRSDIKTKLAFLLFVIITVGLFISMTPKSIKINNTKTDLLENTSQTTSNTYQSTEFISSQTTTTTTSDDIIPINPPIVYPMIDSNGYLKEGYYRNIIITEQGFKGYYPLEVGWLNVSIWWNYIEYDMTLFINCNNIINYSHNFGYRSMCIDMFYENQGQPIQGRCCSIDAYNISICNISIDYNNAPEENKVLDLNPYLDRNIYTRYFNGSFYYSDYDRAIDRDIFSIYLYAGEVLNLTIYDYSRGKLPNTSFRIRIASMHDSSYYKSASYPEPYIQYQCHYSDTYTISIANYTYSSYIGIYEIGIII